MTAGCELKLKFLPADGKFLHPRGRGGAVFFKKFREIVPSVSIAAES